MQRERPSVDAWLAEVKTGPEAPGVGMCLIHNGIVRGTSRSGAVVTGMELSYNPDRLGEVIEQVSHMDGVAYVRAWVNSGTLQVGDDIMYALVAGDIREHVFGALQELVRKIKTEVVDEMENRA